MRGTQFAPLTSVFSLPSPRSALALHRQPIIPSIHIRADDAGLVCDVLLPPLQERSGEPIHANSAIILAVYICDLILAYPLLFSCLMLGVLSKSHHLRMNRKGEM